MTEENARFEAWLRKNGDYYFRPNVTVHYCEGQGFWANWKGDESPIYKTFKGFMRWQDWVQAPDADELKEQARFS